MTPLERAARAAARSSAACSAEDRDEYEADWAGYVPLVRAVLQAIREPDQKMVHAGAKSSLSGPLHDVTRAMWRSMIDAAVEEGACSPLRP